MTVLFILSLTAACLIEFQCWRIYLENEKILKDHDEHSV